MDASAANEGSYTVRRFFLLSFFLFLYYLLSCLKSRRVIKCISLYLIGILYVYRKILQPHEKRWRLPRTVSSIQPRGVTVNKEMWRLNMFDSILTLGFHLRHLPDKPNAMFLSSATFRIISSEHYLLFLGTSSSASPCVYRYCVLLPFSFFHYQLDALKPVKWWQNSCFFMLI